MVMECFIGRNVEFIKKSDHCTILCCLCAPAIMAEPVIAHLCFHLSFITLLPGLCTLADQFVN